MKYTVFLFFILLLFIGFSLANKNKSQKVQKEFKSTIDEVGQNTQTNLPSDKSLVLIGRGEYLAGSIYINGLPFTVILDTTLTYLFVAKKKCEGCSQFPPYYKESSVSDQIQCDSPTCHSLGNICEKPNKLDAPTCGYATTLQGGASIRTNLVRDLISIDDFKNIPVIIAGIYEQENSNSLQQAIFGIGPSCPSCPPSPLQTILTTLKKPYIFGISLDKNYFGGMSLGMIDPLLYAGGINYTTMIKTNNLYSFMPNYIGSYWNGEIFHVVKENLTLFTMKTASALSYCPPVIYNQLKTFFRNGCKNDFSVCSRIESLFNISSCMLLSEQQMDQLPNIEIYFNEGFSLSISPRVYLTPISKNDQVYHCIGILESNDAKSFTVGINLMRELYIIFDNDNSKIGFSKK